MSGGPCMSDGSWSYRSLPDETFSHESFGEHLAQLRRRRGLSQRRLAELLCAASGVPTVSRNEVSRWERGLRTPARPWLAWLSRVLDAPMPEVSSGLSTIEIRRWRIVRGQLRAGHRRQLP